MREALVFFLLASPAFAQDTLGIGYVLDHALPVLAGVNDEDFTENVAIGARWQSFDNEDAMLQALEASEIGIAIGVSPEAFLDAVSQGFDLQLIDVAAVFVGQWNCVLRSEIAESKAALFGLRVALPYGSGAEMVFRAQMTALGGDVASSILHDLASRDAAGALLRGDAEIACGQGPALAQMREAGVDLMDANATFNLGQRWFSGVVVTGDFARSNGATLTNFLLQQQNLGGNLADIAKAADMGEIDAEAGLAAQRMVGSREKLGPDWFGGGLQNYLTGLAQLRAERGLFLADISLVANNVNGKFLAAD